MVREEGRGSIEDQTNKDHLTTNNYIRDIVGHPAFKGFGELMLPWEDNTRYFDTQLNQVGSLMPYHGHVNANVVVGALNRLIDEAGSGKTIFYDFYTERQKQEEPTKKYTGLFFYRGKPAAPFAIVCPGGGFSYVGSLHEGFPLAWEISKKGLNAFVIRYRVGLGVQNMSRTYQTTIPTRAEMINIIRTAFDRGVTFFDAAEAYGPHEWAARKQATPAQISLAWLMAQKPWIVPIPGTTQMPHMIENIGAAAVQFKPAELAELDRSVSAIQIRGARLPDAVLVFSGVEAPPKK